MRALIIICLASLVAAPAMAARNTWVTGKVISTVVSEDAKFGGCLVKLDTPYQDQVPACENAWLSFDCAGLFTEKSSGARRLDAAILSAAMGIPIRARISGSRKVDGWCVADRVDVQFATP